MCLHYQNQGIDLKNRIIMAPPSPNVASHEGLVTRDFVDWMRPFARGGAAVIYVGNASIDRTECLTKTTSLICVKTKHPAAFLVCRNGHPIRLPRIPEINHNGKDTAPEAIGRPPSASPIITASEISRPKGLTRPNPAIEMTHEKIAETVEKYAMVLTACSRRHEHLPVRRARQPDFPVYQSLYNKRTDEYGGSLENRARFAIEVCKAIREKCGPNFIIDFRISADEIAPEGMHFPETLELIGILKDYIDMLNVSAGLHSDFDFKYYRNWCQNYMMERGYNVHYARKIKERYPDLLVTAVGP